MRLNGLQWSPAAPLSVFLIYVLTAAPLSAGRPGDPEACAGCGVCGAGIGMLILLPVVIFALNIALLVWVARDAKSRGMDSAVLWMLLVLFTSLIGFIIYILSRPQGKVMQCPTCGNNRLQASAKCPHCGNA